MYGVGFQRDMRAYAPKATLCSTIWTWDHFLTPTVKAISAGLGALWTRKVETDKLELETIKTQLEAAKWPDFGGVAPAQ